MFISGHYGKIYNRYVKIQNLKINVKQTKSIMLHKSKINNALIYDSSPSNCDNIYLDSSNFDFLKLENLKTNELSMDNAHITKLNFYNIKTSEISAINANIGYYHLDNVSVSGPIGYTNLQVDEIFINNTRHSGTGTAEGALIKKGTRLGLYDDPSKPFHLEKVRGAHTYGILNP